MAAKERASFNIEGDASRGINAAKGFGEAITSLTRRLTTLSKKRTEIAEFNYVMALMNKTTVEFSINAKKAAEAARDLKAAMTDLSKTPVPEQWKSTTQPMPETAVKTEPLIEQKDWASMLGNIKNVDGAVNSLIDSLSLMGPKGMAAAMILRGAFDKLDKTILGTSVKLGDIFNPLKAAFAGAKLSKELRAKFFAPIERHIDQLKKKLSTLADDFGKSIKNLAKPLTDAFDSLRSIARGFMNISRSVMFFISLPMAGVLYMMTNTIIDFDHQLKRVQKTTDLTTKQLGWLKEQLIDLANITPMSHVELAKLAEQVGQLGVRDPRRIMEMVNIANKLTVATNIAADEVVLQLGRIANAFGYNLNESTEEVWRLANVVNILERSMPVLANEVVEATLKFAPIAELVKISAQDAMALGAALVSMGYDASAAGTALRSVGTFMAKNREEVARLMSATDKYNTVAKVTAAMQEDFARTLLDFLFALSQETRTIEALEETMTLLNLRGGRAAASFAGNFDNLVDALALARDEFDKAESILREYDIMQSSVSSQLQILKNNFNSLAIAIGDAVLPVVTQLVQQLIPAIQWVIGFFKALTEQQQLWVVATLLILAISGPLMMFLSQIGHGLALIGMGMSGLIKFIPAVFGLFLRSIISSLSIINIFRLRTLLLIGAFLLIGAVLQRFGVNVAGIFQNIAKAAEKWGENLMKSYSGGIIQGVLIFLMKAINFVATTIARFLQAKSPPKEGLLKDIVKWGTSLIRAYLSGFALADFSVLEDVGRSIEKILSNIAAAGRIGDIEQFTFLLDARENLAKLLTTWRETGIVSQDILHEITKNLGDAAEDVKELILRWVEYADVQRRLEKIEQTRKKLMSDFRKASIAISRAGGTAQQRVANMRALLREHNAELRKLDELKAEEEERAAAAKDALQWQQALINAMNTQDDIMRRLLDAVEKLAGAAEDAFTLPKIDPWDFPPIPVGILEPFYELETRINNAKLIWESFLAGLRGEDISGILATAFEGVDLDTFKWMETVNDWGQTIRGTWLDIKAIWDTLWGRDVDLGYREEEGFKSLIDPETFQNIMDFIDSVQNAKDEVQEFLDGIFKPKESDQESIFERIGRIVTEVIAGIDAAWKGLTGQELGELDSDLENLEETLNNIHSVAEDVRAIFDFIVGFITGFAAGISAHFPTISENFDKLKEALNKFRESAERLIGRIEGTPLADLLQKIIDVLFPDAEAKGEGFGYILGQIVGWLISGAFEKAVEALEWFVDILTNFMNIISDILAIKDAIDSIWSAIVSGILAGIMGDEEELRRIVSNLIIKLIDIFLELLRIKSPSEVMMEIGESIVDGLLAGISDAWQLILDLVGEKIQDLINFIKNPEKLRQFFNSAKDLRDKLKAGLTDRWDEIKGSVSEKIQGVIENIKSNEKLQGFLESAKSLRDKLKEGLTDKWGDIRENISEKVQGVIENIKSDEKLQGFFESAESLRDKLKEGLTDKWDEIKESVSEKIQGIIENVKSDEKLQGFFESAESLRDKLKAGLTDKWDEIKESVSEKIQGIIVSIKSNEKLQGFFDAAKDLRNKLKAGLTDKWDEIKESVSEKIQSVIENIKSNEKLQGFFDAAEDLRNKLKEGLTDKWDEIKEGVSEKLKLIIEFIKSPEKRQEIFDAGLDLVKSLWSGFISFYEDLTGELGTFISNIISSIGTKASEFFTAGSGIAQSLKDGFSSFIGGINFSEIMSPFQSAIDVVQGVFRGRSPSREFWDIAQDVILGFIGGIDEMSGLLNRKMSETFLGTVGDIQGSLMLYPNIPATTMVGGESAAPIIIDIDIEEMVVRDDKDIDQLAEKVYQKFNRRLSNAKRFRGVMR